MRGAGGIDEWQQQQRRDDELAGVEKEKGREEKRGQGAKEERVSGRVDKFEVKTNYKT